MLTLEIFIGLNSSQGDETADLLNANIGEVKNFYINITKGSVQYSKTGSNKCLKVKNTLYGLRHIPRAFWQYLTNKLDACG